ncbi:hypothetical protein MNBD_UNCLBAC01-2062 [hydrothermal vent metagenome]|uniref:Uncharacterized protein n=1 Tax=hydrothermal vent metagenome TaxID=652676 RepID=A0A3B1D168_9ZZZZ
MFYYEDVLKGLNKAKVRYVVFGGVAAILHGVHRTTMDIDIIVDMTADNIEKLFKILEKIGYRPRLPVVVEEFKDIKKRKMWEKEKNMKVFTFFHTKDPLKMVDIAIEGLVKYEKVEKEIVKVGNMKVPIISVEQLKKMKKKAGRKQDLADLDELKRLGDML